MKVPQFYRGQRVVAVDVQAEERRGSGVILGVEVSTSGRHCYTVRWDSPPDTEVTGLTDPHGGGWYESGLALEEPMPALTDVDAVESWLDA